MFKFLTMKRAKQIAHQAVEAPILIIREQRGEPPAEFWQDEYVHGYLVNTALYTLTLLKLQGQIRELNELEQLEVITSIFNRVDPTNTFLATMGATDEDAYRRGTVAAMKCLDHVFGVHHDKWKDDPDVLRAQQLAKASTIFGGVDACLLNTCWTEYVIGEFFSEKK